MLGQRSGGGGLGSLISSLVVVADIKIVVAYYPGY